MTKYLQKILLIVFSFFILITAYLIAGTTGKIAGRAVDKSGTPLPGVNIIIENTTLGAATDIDGYYTILNVPPGDYVVKASMVGYKTVSIKDVRVNIDQTTRIDFELEEASFEVEEITVTAARKIVEGDVSSSVTTIKLEEIKTLPVSSVSGLIQLQAGVESGLVIRGGNANQSLFLVDGFAMRDARNNLPVTTVALSSIQEVSLERGGFNAEYGQVRSGILNVITKEGNKTNYNAYFTARYSPPAYKHFDISPYDPNSFWLRPYLDPGVAYVGTQNGSWDEFTQAQYPVFEGWNEVSRKLLEDSDPTNDLSPEGAKRLFEWQHRKRPITDQADYDIDASIGGPIPLVGTPLGDLRFFLSYKRTREMLLIPLTRDDYLEDNWNLKLTSDIGEGMKLTLTGTTGKSFNIAVNGTEQATFAGTNGLPNYTTYLRTPFQIANNISLLSQNHSRVFSDSYYSLAELNHLGVSSSFTHVISSNTFYDVRLDFFQREYKTGPTSQRSSNLTEIMPGYFVDEAPFGFSPIPSTGIGVSEFFFGGHTSTARDSSKTSSFSFKIDLTSQVNFNNQVKTGVEFVYNNLDLNFGIVNQVFPESNQYIRKTYNPIRAAFYIQDKIEFEGFIANAGVRLDYTDSQADWADVDAFNKLYFGSRYSQNTTFNVVSPKKQFSVSPRLGISHPITENSKLFFNYGHFKQLPSYDQLFQLSRGSSNQVRLFGNPNLELAKTISYELGYDHALFDEYLIQVAGFYHDITDQLAVTRYASADGTVNYNAINSNNYEDIRGFELTLKKLAGPWLRGFLTYTYQVTSQGRFGRDQVFEDPSAQKRFDQTIGNFAQNKPVPQPYANLVLTFSTPSDFGPEFLGKGLFGDFYLTLIGNWRAGFWASLGTGVQNVQSKDYWNLDLRFSKDIDLGNLILTFLVDVSNVLNIRRLSLVGFENNEDFTAYWQSLHLPGSNDYENIVGDDKYGEFRDPGVPYQPIIRTTNVFSLDNPSTIPFYYETSTGRYMQFVNGNWQQIDDGALKKVLDDKAYIDMPNMTSFNFLNPRNVYIGISAQIKL
jgi:outer membrane receptor protein involved in Fe transport